MNKKNYFKKISIALLVACTLLVSVSFETAAAAQVGKRAETRAETIDQNLRRLDESWSNSGIPKAEREKALAELARRFRLHDRAAEKLLKEALTGTIDAESAVKLLIGPQESLSSVSTSPISGKSKYARFSLRESRESRESIEQRKIAAAARMMPPESPIVHVLTSWAPSGEIKITNIKIFTNNSQKVVNIPELSQIEELKHAQRVLLTPKSDNRKIVETIRKQCPETPVLFSGPDINEAAKSINALLKKTINPDDVAVAFLFPRNAEQQERQGLRNWTETDRKDAWRARDYFLKETGISYVITRDINRVGPLEWFMERVPVRDQLIQDLQGKKGQFILFCHGTREKLYLPDGGILTAKEISELKLPNKPLVCLFSCKGGEPGPKDNASISLEAAFKKAGAEAVLSFPTELTPGNAASFGVKVIKNFKMMPILKAIEKTMLEYQQKDIKSRLKVEIDPKLPNWRETEIGFLLYGYNTFS